MTTTTSTTENPASGAGVVLTLAWLAVGLPLLWGVYETFIKAVQLFK